MKNFNTSEVKTIFPSENCQIKSSTYEEEPNNDILENTKKKNDNSDNLRQKFFPPEINECTTSKSIELSGTGNIIITNGNSNQSIVQNQLNNQLVNSDSTYRYHRSFSTLCESCCTASAKKIYFGICVTICVTTSWVGATHCIKFLYFQKSYVNTNHLQFKNFSYSQHHNQQIVAVILCDTGIALLAYMDGITGSPTLGGVVLAASAAAGSAVYKVLFKKVIGDANFGQISLFFSMIGICNAALLWPIWLVLYFSGVEYILWMKFPWAILFIASILHLVANMLGNFSIAVTYNLFITLGLITAVPVSAALDVILYGANFAGMKLAGMILIATGFFLVMFPNNWPDYFTRLLRWSRRHRHGMSGGLSKDIVDYRTGYIKSHLRSPSGRVR
ncbi:solute carrier family 35 member F4 isoform X3 [Phymastichus coffea]|uniref:solute carrier family 35 member F4 isoform X3 n=1 Tax=Phymastichus coffea TaxID=108790 RepID=UPI00273B63F6|nr:solute carrier family 35 member F4 isoform X3 [Phymastichus coffea]